MGRSGDRYRTLRPKLMRGADEHREGSAVEQIRTVQVDEGVGCVCRQIEQAIAQNAGTFLDVNLTDLEDVWSVLSVTALAHGPLPSGATAASE